MRLQTALILILSAPAYAGQTVMATWYGQELAGNRTASGERFNPNGLTAAHGHFLSAPACESATQRPVAA
jgi:rare lipoprotein A (peptidoglycan hydrolase)